MKIGFDAKRANANNTGLGNYSRFVIEALAEYASRESYLLYLPKRKSNREYDKLLDSYSNVEERLPSGSIWRGMLSSLWRTRAIKRDLERDGVEIFHGLSNEIPVGLDSGSVRSVVTIHDLIFLRRPEGHKAIDRWIYSKKFRYACHHADRVIAVSECTKRDIVELYGVDPIKVEVIYQGCDSMFNLNYREEQLSEVRGRYNLPERYILNVGTIESRKNLLLGVKALEHLSDDIHLVAVGRATPYLDEVMQYAEQRGLSGRVKVVHNCQYTDLPLLYRGAEVSIYPSYYEGFGIPIIESMSCGTPVVAATGSCLEEAGGDAAAYVSPDDDVACAAEIRRFMEDLPHRNEAIERGLSYVERFSKRRIAEDITRLYMEILSLQN